MEHLLLRLDAPLMSFGRTTVDARGFTAPSPGCSLLTGLLANALGWDHSDAEQLESLQARLHYAVRRDRAGELLTDYQTVDLGQPFLEQGWTTWGAPESRGGGTASTGTHIREREYWSDSVFTVALRLQPPDAQPDLHALATALQHPARPLFIGRKACLPAAPLLLGQKTAASLLEALRQEPLAAHGQVAAGGESPSLEAWWPAKEAEIVDRAIALPVSDSRDWSNQVHVGRRFVVQGQLALQPLEKLR